MSSTIDLSTGQDLSQNRQGELRAINIAIVAVATFFVGLRFYARWRAGVHWGIDDWLLVVSLLVLYGLLAIILLMINWGLGIHAAALQYTDIVSVLKGLLAFECVYVTVVAIIKISLLFMYRRAFDIRSLRIQAYILGAIVISWCIAIIMVCVFQCTPVAKAWNPMLDGHCIDLKASFIGNAIPNIVTDVLILALPIRYVWKMVPDKTLRWQLSIVFLLGSLVVFISIYRFVTLFQFVPSDTTWTLATSCAWCVIECAVGIVSVCLPTLGPLLSCLSCVPVARGGSAMKNRSNRSAQSSNQAPGNSGKFNGVGEIGYAEVLRNTVNPLALHSGSRTRSFERLGSDEGVEEDAEIDAIEMEEGAKIKTTRTREREIIGGDRNDHWDSEDGEIRFSGLRPRDMSGSYKT